MSQSPPLPGTASPEDVLHVVTQLMHTGEKPADQLKAADMLAKHHGLLTPKEEAAYDPGLIAEIEAAVAEIAAEYNEPEPDIQGDDPSADDTASPDGPVVRP